MEITADALVTGAIVLAAAGFLLRRWVRGGGAARPNARSGPDVPVSALVRRRKS